MPENNPAQTRFVAIIPALGSAYYIHGEDELVQVPLDEGYAYVAGPEVDEPDDGGGEVDWVRGFETDADLEAHRQIARTLSCLPNDATAPGGDPVLVGRAHLSDLLLAIGSARVRVGGALSAEAEDLKRASGDGADQEIRGRRMKLSGEDLIRASGAMAVTPNPLADLLDLMPEIRWRDADGPQP